MLILKLLGATISLISILALRNAAMSTTDAIRGHTFQDVLKHLGLSSFSRMASMRVELE
jgi:hypothetical protein